MSGITATLTQSEQGVREPVTHVGQPSSIRQESGTHWHLLLFLFLSALLTIPFLFVVHKTHSIQLWKKSSDGSMKAMIVNQVYSRLYFEGSPLNQICLFLSMLQDSSGESLYNTKCILYVQNVLSRNHWSWDSVSTLSDLESEHIPTAAVRGAQRGSKRCGHEKAGKTIYTCIVNINLIIASKVKSLSFLWQHTNLMHLCTTQICTVTTYTVRCMPVDPAQTTSVLDHSLSIHTTH